MTLIYQPEDTFLVINTATVNNVVCLRDLSRCFHICRRLLLFTEYIRMSCCVITLKLIKMFKSHCTIPRCENWTQKALFSARRICILSHFSKWTDGGNVPRKNNRITEPFSWHGVYKPIEWVYLTLCFPRRKENLKAQEWLERI